MPPSPSPVATAIEGSINKVKKQRNKNPPSKTTARKPKAIRNVNTYDIICSKASRTFELHPGNIWYNYVIDQYTPQYGCCYTVIAKNQITKQVIKQLQEEHRESRFIEPMPSLPKNTNGPIQHQQHEKPLYCRLWPPKRVHDKVSHALRTRWRIMNDSSHHQQQQKRYNDVSRSSRTLAAANMDQRESRDMTGVQRHQHQQSNYEEFISTPKTPWNVTNDINNTDISHDYLDVDSTGYTSDQFKEDFEFAMKPDIVPQIERTISASTTTRTDNQPPLMDKAFMAKSLRQTPTALLPETHSIQRRRRTNRTNIVANMAVVAKRDNNNNRQPEQKRQSFDRVDELCYLMIDLGSIDDIRHSTVEPIRSSSNTARNNRGRTNNRNIRQYNTNPQLVLSSSTSNIKEEEEDPRKVPNRNSYYYYRRQKIKKEKQHEYNLATPEQRLEIKQQQIQRRNYYYYCRRQVFKKEKENGEQHVMVC
jgi:hypothetical protein